MLNIPYMDPMGYARGTLRNVHGIHFEPAFKRPNYEYPQVAQYSEALSQDLQKSG